MHSDTAFGPLTLATAGPGSGLSWSRTVERQLVHRNSVAEVLLTDLRRINDVTFAAAAQWPRSHRVYRPDRAGRPDPMLLLETVRQVGLAVSHQGFGVGQDHGALMGDIGFDLNPGTEPRRPDTAADVAIEVSCVDIRTRHGALSRLTVLLTYYADGLRFATGSGTVSWLPTDRYRALRQRNRPVTAPGPSVPAAPSPSRSRSGSDSLIAIPDADYPRRRVLVPLTHPVYFDHPLDHVPGLLLVDAAWQAASQRLPPERRLLRASMACHLFTELAPAALISLTTVSETVIEFEIEQSGRITSTGSLEFGC